MPLPGHLHQPTVVSQSYQPLLHAARKPDSHPVLPTNFRSHVTARSANDPVLAVALAALAQPAGSQAVLAVPALAAGLVLCPGSPAPLATVA